MAIIYSYPLNQPKRDDLLIGTITYDEDAVNPVHGNPTVSFTVGSLLDLIASQGAAQNLQQVTNIGNTTTNSIIISNSLKVSGGYYDSSNQPGTAGQLLSSTATGTQWVNVAAQGVTSVGLSMPAAFTVANSPVTQAGILAVTGAGTAVQYINGLGNLVTFPTIPTQYVLPVATTVALGGIKIGYTEAGKNYPLELDNERAYVNVPWTDTIYTLPLAADGIRGGVQIGYTQTSTRDYPVTLASEKMLVTVPWSDTIQTIAGTGTDNTDSGVLLSDSGGTVLILGDGSVTAAQTGNTITLTGTDTGVTGVTLATADSTGSPLSESITNRELTLTSAKYVGGANVGYVPEGGTGTTYLKGDGTWEAIPTGLIFKGVWDASGTGGGSPDLTSITPADGWLYIVSVAGSAEPNGVGTTPNSWNIGDWCVYSSTVSAWELVPSSTTGVDTVKTTDGTYIDLTPSTATNGAVEVTADLSAADGNNTGTSQRFLTKNNTWAVPAYTTDNNTTYTVDVPSATTSINLKGSDGTDDAIVLTGGNNVTLSRTDASTIDIAATNTTYTAGIGLTLNTLEFDVNVDSTASAVPESLSTTANQTYKIQLDDQSENLVVNVPWTDTLYDWEIKDNQGTPSTGDVASGKTVQFVGATGALSTVLTDPNSDGNFVMTLTSPNDDTLYALAGAADGAAAANYNLVLSADGTAQNTMVFKQGSDITFTRAANSLTIAAANDNTLYDLSGTASATAGEYNLVLSADSTAQDTMVFKQGSNVTFTRADDLLTIAATNTWIANAVTVAGYVAAPAATDANLVWKTDTNGNPAWRIDDTGDNTTYSIGSGNTKIITLTGSDSSTSTVTFADGSDISIAGNNGTITITNDSPDTGIPAVISDGAAAPSLSFPGNVTAAMVRTQIGAGTGDGVVESLTTTAIPTSPYMSVATLSAAGVLNIPNVPRYTLDVDQSSQGNNNDPLITLDASSTTDDSIQISGGDLITVTRAGASEIEIASTAAPNTVFEKAYLTGSPSAPGGLVNNIGTKGLVPAPPASTAPNTDKYYLTSNETWTIPPGQGIIAETVAVGDATVNNTPLAASINSNTRTLTLTSKKYKGGSLVGYVPDGGTNSTYLRGDGTWSSIGSQFQGTWDASGGGGGIPYLIPPPFGSSPYSNGDFYICSDAGNATPNGPNTTPNSWGVGDTVIWSGSSSSGSWTRVPATSSGVNSVDTTDGTYINLTPNSPSTGSITVTADLSAAATGTSTVTTKFLTEGNKWQVPSYTTNINTTYDLLAVATGGTNTNPALRLDPSSGGNDDIVLNVPTNGCMSITRTSNTQIDFVNTCPDTGIPAILTDGANPGVISLYDDVDAADVRSAILAGTMSSFTVSADTNTAATTISDGNTLKILGGTNCETISNPDGTITINSTDTQGVSKIVAGTNVTISPPGGTGNVTINSTDTQENTKWYVRDSGDDDKLVNNLKYLKFVTATGALGTDLTGTGTTSDPYVMTLTSPDTDTNTTYTSGNGINFSGTPATQINADINYISYNGNNNFIDSASNLLGSAIPTQGRLLYRDTSNQKIVSMGYVEDLPFEDGTVTSVTAGTGMTQTGTSTTNPTLNVIAGNGLTANANNITMSGSYTGDLALTGTLTAVGIVNNGGIGVAASGASANVNINDTDANGTSTTYESNITFKADGVLKAQMGKLSGSTNIFTAAKNFDGPIDIIPRITANRIPEYVFGFQGLSQLTGASLDQYGLALNSPNAFTSNSLYISPDQAGSVSNNNSSIYFGGYQNEFDTARISLNKTLGQVLFDLPNEYSGTITTGAKCLWRKFVQPLGGSAYMTSLMEITSGGVTNNASGSYGTISSDVRLKENITDATSKLDDILSLKVKNFNFINDDVKQIGFIAQEFESVFPSLVTTQDTRIYAIQDENGQQLKEQGELVSGFEDGKSLKVGMEFAILTKAIQEQQEIIESLKQRIEQLEN